MVFILTTDFTGGDRGNDLAELKARYARYHEYLRTNSNRFPSSAYSFAVTDWRLNPEDHRCPHDSWVESLAVLEPSSGDRSEKRELEIRVRLLGAYHDRYLSLVYSGVRSYCLETPTDLKSPPYGVGHGDWLYDEVRLSDRGYVLHEIEFSRGSRWTIECDNIDHQWEEIRATQ